MFCPHCGTETRDDHAYCPACGTALPASRPWAMTPARSTGLLNLVGDPGIRLLAYGVAGLLAMLLLAEVVKAVVAVALPLLIVLAILYWARERRRRYY
jgi:predicted amidophosphoribosyltransferase